jgi:hypothetical protein
MIAPGDAVLLDHRGYVAVDRGATDCPYPYLQDLVAGRYRVPWEDQVEVPFSAGGVSRPAAVNGHDDLPGGGQEIFPGWPSSSPRTTRYLTRQ